MTTHITDRIDLLTISEAARRLPGRPHRSTLWRWARKGIETPTRERVFLRTLRLGRRVLIAPEDVDAFVQALGEAAQHEPVTHRHRPAPQRPRRSSRAEQAEREAEELGI